MKKMLVMLVLLLSLSSVCAARFAQDSWFDSQTEATNAELGYVLPARVMT